MWGRMTGPSLTGIHFLPQGQTLTVEYNINNMLEKEVKPLLHYKKKGNEATDKQKLFSSNCHMTFVQDRAPAHARSQGHPSMVQKENRQIL